jgi:hypothetical protein
MRDPIVKTVSLLRERGVVLELNDGKLRCKGMISPDERRLLVENAPIVEAILNPDLTLPDVLVIPASVPYDAEAIAACIDCQRIRRAA